MVRKQPGLFHSYLHHGRLKPGRGEADSCCSLFSGGLNVCQHFALIRPLHMIGIIAYVAGIACLQSQQPGRPFHGTGDLIVGKEHGDPVLIRNPDFDMGNPFVVRYYRIEHFGPDGMRTFAGDYRKPGRFPVILDSHGLQFPGRERNIPGYDSGLVVIGPCFSRLLSVQQQPGFGAISVDHHPDGIAGPVIPQRRCIDGKVINKLAS